MVPVNAARQDRPKQWVAAMQDYFRRLADPPPLVVEGKLSRMVGLTLEAVGCQAAIGDRCTVANRNGTDVDAEVVGFAGDRLFLMPTGIARGLAPNARVLPVGGAVDAAVGEDLLGRVIDGAGRPLDGGGALHLGERRPLYGEPVNPLDRAPIAEPLDVGVRSINALLTVGRGQRLGLFGPSGVGKSVLLGMMTRFADADVIVVALVGERGREVKEFIDQILGAAGLSRAVVVATPADTPPLMRLHGANSGYQHCRAFSRPWASRAAADGLAHALCASTARDCVDHRRTTGDPRLSAIRFRALAATGRTRRHWIAGKRCDNGVLHRAHGG